jgi:hypothetical protein
MATKTASDTIVGGDNTATTPTTTAADNNTEPQGTEKVYAYNDEKTESLSDQKHLEHVMSNEGNLVYNDVNEEPELHARTYIALLAMFLLNYVQVLALQSPPAVVSLPCNYFFGKRLI